MHVVLLGLLVAVNSCRVVERDIAVEDVHGVWPEASHLIEDDLFIRPISFSNSHALCLLYIMMLLESATTDKPRVLICLILPGVKEFLSLGLESEYEEVVDDSLQLRKLLLGEVLRRLN